MEKYNSYNLMVKIVKDILLQYYEQFEKSINDYKKKLNSESKSDKYTYETYVTRAERFKQGLRQIIINLEKSIFNGEVNEKTTNIDGYKNIPLGRETQMVLINNPELSQEEVLNGARRDGIHRVLGQLCIHPSVVGDSIYYAYMLLKEPNEIEFTSISNEFPQDMVFTSDNLTINNDLLAHIHNGILSPLVSYEAKYITRQTKKFTIDAKRTCAVINEHIHDPQNVTSEMLSQNEDEVFCSLFQDLLKLLPVGNIKLKKQLEVLSPQTDTNRGRK